MNKNRSPKIVMYLWIIASITLFFLHNPTEGYENISYVIDALESRNPLTEENCFSNKGSLKIYCIHENPFTEWRSKGAILAWLADIGNLIWGLGFIAMLACTTYFVFGKSYKKA